LQEQVHRYSHIRLWGSVGFIAAVLGIGQFLDYFSIAYLPEIVLSLMLLNWLIALTTPETQGHTLQTVKTSLRQLMLKGEVIAFFCVYLLLQIAHGPYYVFYSVYLQQHGYSSSITGLLWALGVCAEILLFLFVSHLLRWFSLRQLLLSSLALSVLRWLLIAYQVDNLPVLIGAQLLHAASFGLAHVVAIQLLLGYFGDQHQGKGQAFYASISFGLGGVIGSMYSGYFWDGLGATQVFNLAALASGLAFLIALCCIARIKG
jgi:PPP family 3-phenylpropionic acid transporter